MNRTAMGLAIGAGYLLGRTKKLKMAMAVGSLVAGKKLNLTPKALADLLSQQLRDNPQFKEIGDQLRQDLRGVGKAASGAMVERQMTSLADRLHGRTAQVRDQLGGVVPDVPGTPSRRDDREADEEHEEPESARGDEGRDEDRDEGRGDAGEEPRRKEPEGRKAPARTAPEKKEKKGPAKASVRRTPRKAPAGGTAKKTTDAARKAATTTASRVRGTKGGDEG
ncbi:DNA primase [Streptomyces sp. NPDC052015]|uniref:DNA primase n=1 Tax=Streptomyces sp. NPDC052015 TaxID=3154755 RepID=UPI0034334521